MAAAVGPSSSKASSFKKSFSLKSFDRGKEKPQTQPPKTGTVIHQGWAVKESGSSFLGKTNWRRRWFVLSSTEKGPLLQYYKNPGDTAPAGYVILNILYYTREMEVKQKGKLYCFAVGPLVDDGATRTFFISCSTANEMQAWMTAIDSAIQGSASKAKERVKKVQLRFEHKKVLSHVVSLPVMPKDGQVSGNAWMDDDDSDVLMGDDGMEYCPVPDDLLDVVPEESISDDEIDSSLSMVPEAPTSAEEDKRGDVVLPCEDSFLQPQKRMELYNDAQWRMKQWHELCKVASKTQWYRTDTKDGVTVSRCKFGRSHQHHAVIKVDGTIPHHPDTVAQFLQLSMKPGGKLDYLFRNETLVDHIDGEPAADVIYNQFQVPLPKVATREVVAIKYWISDYMTEDGTEGLVMFSVDHPGATPPDLNTTRIHVDPSGCILLPHLNSDGTVCTRVIIVVQILLGGGLHRMLKGAYNSGLLKLGLRSSFQHISEQFKKFAEMTGL